MNKSAQLMAKRPEAKGEHTISRKPKTTRSQSRSSPADRILFLQRTIGNRAVHKMMRSGALQAKLRIGQPNDKYEQEADRVADQVMRMPEPGVQRQPAIQAKPLSEQITPLIQRQLIQRQEEEEDEKKVVPEEEPKEEEEEIRPKPLAGQITPLIQRQSIQRQGDEEDEEVEEPGEELEGKEPEEEPEKEEEPPLMAKQAGGPTPRVSRGLEAQIHSIRGSGQPLPRTVRNFFEPRFGQDFSQVRVHADNKAAMAAKSVNAHAFTLGRDIVFGSGQYSSSSEEGKKLLAHELTHVIQQKSNSANRIQRRYRRRKSSQRRRQRRNDWVEISRRGINRRMESLIRHANAVADKGLRTLIVTRVRKCNGIVNQISKSPDIRDHMRLKELIVFYRIRLNREVSPKPYFDILGGFRQALSILRARSIGGKVLTAEKRKRLRRKVLDFKLMKLLDRGLKENQLSLPFRARAREFNEWKEKNYSWFVAYVGLLERVTRYRVNTSLKNPVITTVKLGNRVIFQVGFDKIILGLKGLINEHRLIDLDPKDFVQKVVDHQLTSWLSHKDICALKKWLKGMKSSEDEYIHKKTVDHIAYLSGPKFSRTKHLGHYQSAVESSYYGAFAAGGRYFEKEIGKKGKIIREGLDRINKQMQRHKTYIIPLMDWALEQAKNPKTLISCYAKPKGKFLGIF